MRASSAWFSSSSLATRTTASVRTLSGCGARAKALAFICWEPASLPDPNGTFCRPGKDTRTGSRYEQQVSHGHRQILALGPRPLSILASQADDWQVQATVKLFTSQEVVRDGWFNKRGSYRSLCPSQAEVSLCRLSVSFFRSVTGVKNGTSSRLVPVWQPMHRESLPVPALSQRSRRLRIASPATPAIAECAAGYLEHPAAFRCVKRLQVQLGRTARCWISQRGVPPHTAPGR